MKLFLLNGVLGFKFYYDYLDELKQLNKADSAVYQDFYSDDYEYNYYFYDDNEPVKVTETTKPIPTPKPVAISVPKPAAVAVPVPVPKPAAVVAPRPPVAVNVPKPVVVAVPAPKPASRASNNDYVYFGSGDGYVYYDDSYYSDDLGSK